MKCNNCGRTHEIFLDVCIADAFLGVSLHSRGSLTEKQAAIILAGMDAAAFWDDVGPIIDRLEEGYYNIDKEDTDG